MCHVHVHASHANNNLKVTMNPSFTTKVTKYPYTYCILHLPSFFLSVLEGSKGNWWSSIEVQVEVIITRQREPEVIYPGYPLQYISKRLIKQCNLTDRSHYGLHTLYLLLSSQIILDIVVTGSVSMNSLVRYCARTDGVILSCSIYYRTRHNVVFVSGVVADWVTKYMYKAYIHVSV